MCLTSPRDARFFSSIRVFPPLSCHAIAVIESRGPCETVFAFLCCVCAVFPRCVPCPVAVLFPPLVALRPLCLLLHSLPLRDRCRGTVLRLQSTGGNARHNGALHPHDRCMGGVSHCTKHEPSFRCLLLVPLLESSECRRVSPCLHSLQSGLVPNAFVLPTDQWNAMPSDTQRTSELTTKATQRQRLGSGWDRDE